MRNPAAEAVAEALRAGVKAVLSSGRTGPEIVAAIEAAAAGLVVLDPTGLETLLRAPSAVSSGGSEALVEALTPRELEVLQLLAAGLRQQGDRFSPRDFRAYRQVPRRRDHGQAGRRQPHRGRHPRHPPWLDYDLV